MESMRPAERLQNILSWLLWPLLVGGALLWMGAAIQHRIPMVAALVALQLVAVPLVAGLERWMPEHASWNIEQRDLRTDALHFLVSGVLISGLLRTAIFAGVPSLGIWPTGWPLLVQFALAIALADLASYLTHLLTHKRSLLWPIHAPHHSSHRLYWLNATRMHPLDTASTLLLSLLPLALLGTPAPVLALFDAFALMHLMLQHSNIRLRHGALSHVIATAEFHRWHHSQLRADGESNYASFFSLWDHLFGTFHKPTSRNPPEQIGLYDGAAMPDGWLGQLRFPFRVWLGRESSLAPRPRDLTR